MQKRKALFILFSFTISCLTLVLSSKNAYCQTINKQNQLALNKISFKEYELPVLSTDTTYYLPSPNGQYSFFCNKGAIFINYPNECYKIPHPNNSFDSEPSWSPNSNLVVLTRDSGNNTAIVLFNIKTKKQTVLTSNKPNAIHGKFNKISSEVYFSALDIGGYNIFKYELADNTIQQITDFSSDQLRPFPVSNDSLLFISKGSFGDDYLELYIPSKKVRHTIKKFKYLGHGDYDYSRLINHVVFSIPQEEHYAIQQFSLSQPDVMQNISRKTNENFLYPRFSSDDSSIYMTSFALDSTLTIRYNNNEIHQIVTDINNCSKKEKSTTVSIKITSSFSNNVFRISAHQPENSFLLPKSNFDYKSDPNTNKLYTYIDSETSITLKNRDSLYIELWKGNEYFKYNYSYKELKSNKYKIKLSPTPIWNNQWKGFYFQSADCHFHINYGGQNIKDLKELPTIMKGENLTYAFPLVANLGLRLGDVELFNTGNEHINVGQELRSHFHGHLGIINGKNLKIPAFWGPYYELFSQWDQSNYDVIAKEKQAIYSYVHPVENDSLNDKSHQLNFESDIIQSMILTDSPIGLEVVNTWSDELGSSKLYDLFLRLNRPVFLTAGSDAFMNFFRTAPIGNSRIYTYKNDSNVNKQEVLESIKKGNSFVSNEPILLLSANNSLPGQKIKNNNEIQIESVIYSFADSLIFELWSSKGKIYTEKVNTKDHSPYSIQYTLKDFKDDYIYAKVYGSALNNDFISDKYSFAISSPIHVGDYNYTKNTQTKNDIQLLLKLLDLYENKLKNLSKPYGIRHQISQIKQTRAILKEMLSMVH